MAVPRAKSGNSRKREILTIVNILKYYAFIQVALMFLGMKHEIKGPKAEENMILVSPEMKDRKNFYYRGLLLPW